MTVLPIVKLIWFFLPAAVANTAPIFAARYNWLTFLNRPIDGGRQLRGQAILGRNKTWRGVLFGAIFGAVTGVLQYVVFLTSWGQALSLVPYKPVTSAVGLGALLGIGALLGDVIKSFFKRRLRIAPGKRWAVFDQIDFVIGALAVSWWLLPSAVLHITLAIIVLGIGSWLTSVIGVALHIKKSL